MNKKLCVFLIFLLMAAAAIAQNAIRGQIILPNGDFPTSPIRFYVSSADGRFNDYRFTDSNGRFIIERPAVAIELTITIDKNEAMGYDTTIRTIVPQYESTPRIILNPLRGAKTPPATVSVASGYQPLPEAAELHKSALKDIEKQQYEAAEPKLRKAVTLDSKFVAAHVDLGALLMQKKEYEEAEAILRRALEADPKSVLALLNLAITLNHLQKHTDAIPVLREALRLQPGLVTAHVHLGVALSETDKFEEAEPELQRGVSKGDDPDIILGLLYLGKLYARMGKYQQAVESFEAYLKKAPDAANAGEVRDIVKKLRQEMAARD